MAKQLTAKEKRFKGEYLISLNPRIAAEKAGYSESIAKTKAYQWINEGSPYFKPDLYEAIMSGMAKREERVEITQDRVLQELAILAFAKMEDYVEIQEDGSCRAKTWAEMPEGASRAVAEVKEVRRIMGSGQGGTEIVMECRLGYKHHSKERALEMLGRHLGMFIDRTVEIPYEADTFHLPKLVPAPAGDNGGQSEM